MCGIIGYIGKNSNAKNIAINGLKNLEYRGYDSSGIAVVEDDKLNIYKAEGKISNLEKTLSDKNILSSIAIAHTRWATHGKPSKTNAHPQQSGCVTLVHNGIIENYNELKTELLKKQVVFNTDTDTEVACAYINELYKTNKNKIEILRKACNNFRGSYAFAIIFEDQKDTIYAARKDSPLILGLSDNGNFIASDVSAILEYTNKYILLNSGEFAKINCNDTVVFNSEGTIIKKDINIANWNCTEYEKNGYKHFMLKEINDQPKVVSNIFKRYMLGDMKIDIDFTKYTNIHIVACGSAMHAGLIGKFLFENYAKIPTMVEVASEYRYNEQLISKSTLVIIISQSGETADTLAALRIAKEKNATVIGIVNTVGSTIAREADNTIYTYAGPEIAVATTKGYTTQIATLSVLAIEALKSKNMLSTKLKANIFNEFKNIEKVLTNTIKNQNEYKKIADCIYKNDDLFFIGRGIDYAISMEGSLKLKEISYMHSEAYPAGELKHGTISLIDNNTPVIVIASNPDLYEKTISNAIEAKSRGAFVIFLTNSPSTYANFANISLTVTKQNDFLQPLVIITALQLIAYETAKLRKCDIDKPKNLAKSVTVE
ncbi:MAG: glutamine--fructose-6-phosphate transaminase (isomerizing) [Clostridia bacterium]